MQPVFMFNVYRSERSPSLPPVHGCLRHQAVQYDNMTWCGPKGGDALRLEK